MKQMTGKQSIAFEEPVYIASGASLVGEKEKEGPLGDYFDHVLTDPMCGGKSWEEGESQMQLAVAKLAIQKANLKAEQIRMIFAGDLLAQSIASCFGLVELNRPIYGLFGACSTMGEALSLGAMAVAGGYGDWVLSLTSSHFGSAEKEFRFPLLMEIRDRCRHPGPSQAAGPVCLEKKGKGKDHGSHHWKDCGLRLEGFPEYGSLHGSGGMRYHLPESHRL